MNARLNTILKRKGTPKLSIQFDASLYFTPILSSQSHPFPHSAKRYRHTFRKPPSSELNPSLLLHAVNGAVLDSIRAQRPTGTLHIDAN